MTREQQNVCAALSQRRQLHRHDSKPVIEVLAEPAHLNRGRQVFAGGREHPGVGRLAACASEPPDHMIFKRLQQLDLQRVGHEPDLIEEDRPAMRDLEEAGLRLLGIRERTPLEPEQLGLE